MTLVTPLPFPLQLNDGVRLTTLGDAVIYFTRLSEKQQQTHYWQRAIRMFDTAAAEPTCLRTATICLQTALLMDGLLSDPQTVPEGRSEPVKWANGCGGLRKSCRNQPSRMEGCRSPHGEPADPNRSGLH